MLGAGGFDLYFAYVVGLGWWYLLYFDWFGLRVLFCLIIFYYCCLFVVGVDACVTLIVYLPVRFVL